MNHSQHAVVCLSGGMDSTSLMLHLLAKGCQVYGLSFDYGQKHKIELERLKANLEYLKSNGHSVAWNTLDMSQLGQLYHSSLTNSDWEIPQGHYEQDNMKATVVPNRNAIFASIAYGYALSIATRQDTEFYQAIVKAFEVGNWDSEKVHLYLPYLNGDKLTILQDADAAIKQLGLDFDTVFRNTITSYQPDAAGRSHGQTGSDVERILAFHHFGRKDPVEYTQPWEAVLENALALEKKAER